MIAEVRCPKCGRTVERPAGRPAPARCPSCGTSLEPERAADTKTLSPVAIRDAAAAVLPAPALPTKFAKYSILGQLGRGGMGVVYKARDPELKRTVALKVLLTAEHSSKEDIERFHREASSAGKLRHPNIVPIHEMQVYEGKYYYTMDLIDGQSLDVLMKRRRFSVRESLELLEKVARALYYAHCQGIVHRDLKPGNIIVDADGEPKVTDFGLAKVLATGEEAPAASSLTASGVAMGTPYYEAPEQASGRSKEVDARSDQYSLGCILYELLTGAPPFTDSSQVAILRKHIEETPLPPNSRGARVSSDVDTICLKCLEKDPARRYPSCLDLAEDIRRFLEGEPISARPPSLTYVLRCKFRKHRAVAGVAVLAVLALFSLGIWSYVRIVQERNAAVVAKEAETRQRMDAERQRRDAEDARKHIEDQQKTILKLQGDLSRVGSAAAVGDARRQEQLEKLLGDCGEPDVKAWLKTVEVRDLALALRGANPAVQFRVMSGMSAYAKQQFAANCREVSGQTITVGDVNAALEKVLAKLRDLAEKPQLAEIRDLAAQSGSFASDEKEFQAVLAVIRKYPNHSDLRRLTLPVRVESVPPGAEARVDGGPPALTPCTVRLSAAGSSRLALDCRGYGKVELSPTIEDLAVSRALSIRLERGPAWRVLAGTGVEAPLALAGSALVFGDSAGTAWRLSAAEGGKTVWRRPLAPGGKIVGGAELDARAAYFAGPDGAVHALALDSGKVLWPAFKPGKGVLYAPRLGPAQLPAGPASLFFGSEDGFVYSLNAATGKLQWKSAEEVGRPATAVAVRPEAVYVCSTDGRLQALSPNTGKSLWSLKLEARVGGSLAVAGGTVYLGADDGNLYAVSSDQGRLRWQYPAGSPICSGPVFSGGRLFFGTDDGDILCLLPEERSASLLWKQPVKSRVLAAPLVTATRVYVGSLKGAFHALDRATGGEIWACRTGDAIKSTAVATDQELVIVATENGAVCAFDER